MFKHIPGIDPSAAMLHFIASNLDHSCGFSRDGTFVHVNSILRDATGLTVDDLIGRPLLSFIHPDDRDSVAAATKTQGLDTAAQRIAARFTRKGGGYCWLEWSPFAQAPNDVFCATVRDLTEDRRLRALAAELEAISEVGTWEIDLDTRFLYWSPVTYRIHDLDPGTHTPKIEDGLSFYPEEAQDEIRAAVAALMEKGERFDLELPFVTAKGRHIWVRATAAAEIIGGKISRVYGTFRDITEKRAQRQHLLRLSSVIHQTRTAVILCGIDRRIEWINPAFEVMSGYTLAEARGQRPGSLVQFEKTNAETIIAVRTALNEGREFNGEFLNRSKDGREYWIDHNIQPMWDAEGHLSGYMAVAVDITERKNAEALRFEAEREARLAQESLKSAVAVLPDAFALYDDEDRLVLFNDRYVESCNLCAPAIVPGARFEDILRYGLARGQYPEAVGREDEWLARRLQLHNETGEAHDMRLPDDRWVRVVEQKTPSGGRVGLRIDITELKDREWRLSEIIRGTNAGTWEWNVQTGEVIINDLWAEMLGYRREDLQPLNAAAWQALIHPDDLAFRGEPKQYDQPYRMKHRNGDWVWVLGRGRVASWTPDGKPLWMFGTHQDITASKRTEENLVRALERAEQATAAKSAFLATMSHEIRTPLNGVLGMAAILEESLVDPTQRQMISTIMESGDVLVSVINDILDFSKIEAGKLQIENIRFRPQELAGKIASLHELKAAEKNLALSVLVSTGAEVPRIGDPNRILQIAHNLVGNAIKFTKSGRITVTLTCDAKGPMILKVADTGIGMTAEQVGRLFMEFEQADSSTTRKYGGTGLGMSIVRRLVEMMGGDIAVESEVGRGTSIRVTMPLAVGAPDIEPDQPQTRPETLQTGLRVLVADDTATNRLVLKTMLERFECRMTLAEGGREAVALCAKGKFDLLMLDICMPDLDGVSTLEEIRAQERRAGAPPVPAFAVTANAMVDQIAEYIRAGFQGHISKPINLEIVRDALLRHVQTAQNGPNVLHRA